MINPSASATYNVWYSTVSGTLTGFYGYCTTVTGSTIQGYHNNSQILSNNNGFSLTALNTWLSATGLSATPISFVPGDTLSFHWNNVRGTEGQIGIEATFLK